MYPQRRVKIERTRKIGIWTFEHIGANFIKIYPTDEYIGMTGSELEKQLSIPYLHRLVRVLLFHSDSSDAAATGDLTVTLKRKTTIVSMKKFIETLWKINKTNKSDVNKRFGEEFEYEGSIYTLAMNTINTDRLYIIFYVQKLGG